MDIGPATAITEKAMVGLRFGKTVNSLGMASVMFQTKERVGARVMGLYEHSGWQPVIEHVHNLSVFDNAIIYPQTLDISNTSHFQNYTSKGVIDVDAQ